MIESFQKTEIGFLPKDWKHGRIDEYFEIQQGKQVSKKNRIGDNQKPFLRTSNLQWGKIILEELDFLHFTEDEETKFELKRNDLLVCEGGDIGRTAIWRCEISDCFYQNHLHRLRAIDNNILPEFVLYWLQYAFVFAKVYFGRGNVTTIPNLSKSRLSELLMPEPSLAEQRQIVFVLSKLQTAIEQQDKLIKTTTELKKALMQKLFTEGTKGEKQKQTEIGFVPESWELVELGSCILSSRYGLSSKGQESGKVPILRMTNQVDGFISDKNLQFVDISDQEVARFKLAKDDVIFNRTNSFELVGRTAIFKLEGIFIFASYLIRIKVDKQKLLPDYLNVYLNSDSTQLRLKSIATRGVSQSNISATRLAGFKIQLPPIEEQNAIVENWHVFNNKILFHQNKKQTLSDLFKTLLHELMTGQRRVNEIDFEQLDI